MKRGLTFLTGMLMGAALFGGGTAYAAGLMAEPSSQTFFVDGKQVYLQAYAIGGNNYVKLRDVGQAVNFNVTYDGATNSVQIATNEPYSEDMPAPEVTAPATPAAPASYTISADHWSREDFSRQANSAVFTGVYDRNLYNAIRQTLVDGNSAAPAYTMVSKENYGEVKRLLGRMDGYFWYDHYVPQNFTNYYEYLDYFAVSAEMSEDYQPALEFIRPAVEQANGMASDREKVKYLNDYLCSLMSYDRKATAGVSQVFTQHSGEIAGACGDYAHNFKFLCGAAGIPCITISTASHSWNLVYADGQWLHVDVSANDLYRQDYILLTRTVSGRTDTAPAATEFLKELLVPGSTK